MANNYFTPGVYLEEISTLPASVVGVSTAVPCFIGYTENHAGLDKLSGSTVSEAVRIGSMLDYESIFGGPLAYATITFNSYTATGISVASAAVQSLSRKYLMYYGMQAYFANGGGPCWIVSVGGYPTGTTSAISGTALTDGLQATKLVDEITLLLFPDAVNVIGASDADRLNAFYGTMTAALAQCADLQDRFVIMDAYQNRAYDAITTGMYTVSNSATELRNYVGTQNLNYGAAYMPYVEKAGRIAYAPEHVRFALGTTDQLNLVGANPSITAATTTLQTLIDHVAANGSSSPYDGLLTDEFLRKVDEAIYANDADTRLAMGPAAAVAGIYATTDRNRGVWKAPANISLNGVAGPVQAITKAAQGDLNVHSTGKSINAIRTFTGKGHLVWGARTLEGNSNEWRYVNVRRTFIYAEESIKKATEFVVFEPNDANTWNKVRAMVENFLTGLWRDGGLAGAKPDDAFFVNVGLGETMTSQDILEGRLIVEIGLAVVRPAEFIILRFSHKLQES
ncbi:MAG: phage tail sheath C-terminal domain-containing protein [Bacteroidota bacterium]